MNTTDENLTVYFNPNYNSYTIIPLEGENSVKTTYSDALKELNKFIDEVNK